MSRKSHNDNYEDMEKDKKIALNLQNDEDDVLSDHNEENDNEDADYELEIICSINENIKQYAQENCLPMGEYLTPTNIYDFIYPSN